MSPPVLYYLPPSPPCRSILLLAKMLDIDFELKIVNILEGEQLKPDFVAMNPQHCVPTMNDEGLVLWERWVFVRLNYYTFELETYILTLLQSCHTLLSGGCLRQE